MSKVPVVMPASVFMRPERLAKKSKPFDKLTHYANGFLQRLFYDPLESYRQYLPAIKRESERLSKESDEQLNATASLIRSQLNREGYNRDRLIKVFALVREVAGRTVNMYHYDVQLMGGLALYHGNVAEMQTGEGKTLTATLPAVAAALSGIPVHIITVNDYLTQRDAEEMAPIYTMLGLSVGYITHNKTPQERKREYSCDVVYCTNKELVFDYLKDRILLKDRNHPLHLHAEMIKGDEKFKDKLLLHGLHYAIVDEADSVLLDDARNPLIISGEEQSNEIQEQMLNEAIVIAKQLEESIHYVIDQKLRTGKLTAEGEVLVLKCAAKLGLYWQARIRSLELVHQALTALLLFERDSHYLVRDGKVQIIDEHTGRVMEDRKWERGLHQLVEIKEACEITKPRNTLARISFQHFFRKYFHLCGMTGTARDVSDELWTVYGQRVISIPTNKICKRVYMPSHVCKTQKQKWETVITDLTELHEQGRPVLVGTQTVSASEHLSQLMHSKGLDHQLLNAKQDKDEANIIAKAGQYGQITIATNMAGRGTDIKLTDMVRQSGGLHVILTELHDAVRIDRQLAGRCARQGDSGSFEIIVSLDDHLLNRDHDTWSTQVIRNIARGPLQIKLGLFAMKQAQKRLQKEYKRTRLELLKMDEKQSELLSFIGNRI